MSLLTRINAHEDVLHVIIEGKFDLDEAKRNFLKVMEAVSKHGASRVLIDGCKVTGEPTVIERFYYAEFAAHNATWGKTDAEIDDRPQFSYALVHPTLDRARFGETVATNRGMNLKVFDNVPDAAAWLKIDPEAFGGK